MLKIYPAETDEDLESVKLLLKEYLAWMETEELISLQEHKAFHDQLVNLHNDFALPDGRLLVAMYQNQAAGCAALREINGDVCEMKRLYVSPCFRGLKIGRKLAEAVVTEARRIGYTHMRVHTLQVMEMANAIYESLGFKKISPYEENIIAGAVFMELKLA